MTTAKNENLPAVSGSKAPATVQDLFEKKKSAISAIVPKFVDPERLMKVALLALSRNPLLAKCTPTSILKSFMTAAQLGLDVGGVLGSAYLVPYRNNKTKGEPCYEAQFIVGYRGLIELARRSGQIESIEARVVREGDTFDVEYGLTPRLVHKPALGSEGPLCAVYAIARLKGGETLTEVMSKSHVDSIRKRSRAADNGPWVTDYEEMARKTVIRRLAKYLPLTIEPLHDAIASSDSGEFGDRGQSGALDIDFSPAEDEQEEAPQSRAAALAERLDESGKDDSNAEPSRFEKLRIEVNRKLPKDWSKAMTDAGFTCSESGYIWTGPNGEEGRQIGEELGREGMLEESKEYND